MREEEAGAQRRASRALDVRTRCCALKRKGFSDRASRALMGAPETRVRARRHASGVLPVYKRVDTCAAEFETSTAYLYSTYEEECEADADRPAARS